MSVQGDTKKQARTKPVPEASQSSNPANNLEHCEHQSSQSQYLSSIIKGAAPTTDPTQMLIVTTDDYHQSHPPGQVDGTENDARNSRNNIPDVDLACSIAPHQSGSGQQAGYARAVSTLTGTGASISGVMAASDGT